MPSYNGDATGEPRDAFGRVIDPPRWFNSLGDEVDLDNIDREYAVRILAHIANRFPVRPELIEKLVEVATNGRKPNADDRARAKEYNIRNSLMNKPYRAPTR